MHKLKELKIWQKAMELAELVYKLTANFPQEEKYGLVSQIRRCSVSVASNIAEGAGRNSQKEFLNFLSIANGALYGLETQILLAGRFSFIKDETVKDLLENIDEIQKMNYGFQAALRKSNR